MTGFLSEGRVGHGARCVVCPSGGLARDRSRASVPVDRLGHAGRGEFPDRVRRGRRGARAGAWRGGYCRGADGAV